MRSPLARVPRRVRRVLEILAGALGSGGAISLLIDHTMSKAVAGSLMVGGWSLAWLVEPTKKADAEARATEAELRRATRGDELIHLFYMMGQEGRYFRMKTPYAGNYQDWLDSAAVQIARYSPSLAAEWAPLEHGRMSPLDPPSPAAVLERLDRITKMHDRISKNGISLEELAAAGFPGAKKALAASAKV